MVYVRKYLDEDFNDVKKIVDDSFSINISKIISTSNSFSLVAVSNDKVVGHVRIDCLYDTFMNKNYFIIGYLCVDQAFRRLGIGKMMLDEVMKIAVENDISYVEITSREEMLYAHHLYEKCGFIKRESLVFRREF